VEQQVRVCGWIGEGTRSGRAVLSVHADASDRFLLVGRLYAEGSTRSYDAMGPVGVESEEEHPRVTKPIERGTVLAHLLRPELVLSNPVPLSSDAFTGFGADRASDHNAEVIPVSVDR
jgi:hypothetical protein